MTTAIASPIDPLMELAFPVLTVPEGKLATVIVPFEARNVVAKVIVEVSDGLKNVECAVCDRAELIPEEGLINEELVLPSVSTLAEH